MATNDIPHEGRLDEARRLVHEFDNPREGTPDDIAAWRAHSRSCRNCGEAYLENCGDGLALLRRAHPSRPDPYKVIEALRLLASPSVVADAPHTTQETPVPASDYVMHLSTPDDTAPTPVTLYGIVGGAQTNTRSAATCPTCLALSAPTDRRERP